ncbi:hypothetical protein E0Z10_g8014 [Xylaria hypoxylon]|uniref:Uncharacterized protein n=1 Tax=Xylaria hypoxylon TaxID=37992 RepID=A0A4Z0YQL6_9PEZI|nr:hypothetical protein E0Z10_g8014 [Xylaria hypoxylon]
MDPCTSLSNDNVVTSQDDIDNGLLSKCTTYQGNILIRNATGTLNFTGQAQAHNISVADCPRLQVLKFPDTYSTYWFEIREVNNLTSVSFPLRSDPITFSGGGISVGANLPSLSIIGAKSLTTFEVGNSTYFGTLTLLDVGLGPATSRDTEWFSSGSIKAAESIEIDSCFDLSSLEDVGTLTVSRVSNCFLPFSSIKSIKNYVLTNMNDSTALAGFLNGRSAWFVDPPSFRINESIILDSLLLPNDPYSLLGYGGDEIVPQVTTVGTDFNITSNANVNFTFDTLTGVGANLVIYNNTNSRFKFDKISTVGSMLLIDNINTTLLWFPALTIANYIHIRGYIDTSVGPNIFPALQSVTGQVVIEAWNDDFDCSKLVQYQQDHMIHYLSCNGMNNGTNSGTKNETNSSTNNGTGGSSHEFNQALSPGAWAGIGVAISVVVAESELCREVTSIRYERCYVSKGTPPYR